MTSEYSISVDWVEEFEEWNNEGRRVLLDSCKHDVQETGYCEKCEISEDDAQPMMNYAYPVHGEPSDEEILKVVKETCLTVMEKDGDYFLALCGGGMDLSQNIGLAYLLLNHPIPPALALEISTQCGLNFSGTKYFKVMAGCKKSLRNAKGWYQNKIKRITEEVKKAKAKKS